MEHVGGDGLDAGDGGGDAGDGVGIGVRAGDQVHEGLARDFREGQLRETCEALIDPLDGAIGLGDDHGVVRPAGHEGELAGGRQAGAKGFLGAAAFGDVLTGARNPARLATCVPGDALGAGGQPVPLAVLVAQAEFLLEEGGGSLEMRRDRSLEGGGIIGMHEIQPGLPGGGHLLRIVAKRRPEAGAVDRAAGGDIPLVDTHLGGIEGQVEAFVSQLEAGLDPAAFLVLGAQLGAGFLGRPLPVVGGLREIHDQAEEGAEAKAGEESKFREGPPVGREELGPGRQLDQQALAEKVEGGILGEAAFTAFAWLRGLEDLYGAGWGAECIPNLHLHDVAGGDVETAVD